MADVAADKSVNLFLADKVTGTTVYDRQGSKLGTVHGVMVNKMTGQIAYAIVSFAGFLSIEAGSVHPLPWRALTYHPNQDSYIVDIDRDRFKDAPRHGEGSQADWSDPAFARRVDRHYGF